nr:pyruvate formate-lyase-activating protein [uncultured Tyzzerella sp.]
MEGYIHSTESFGTVDGPGVRFVVFTQGCPLRCLYCHNPDTWQINTGTKMTADEILAKYDLTKGYYKDGGLTVTGGEPLLQIDFVTELFEKAKNKNIHTCLDTSGIIFDKANEKIIEKIDKLLSFTDLILLDLKHIDNEQHKNLCAVPNTNILDFAKYLSDKNQPIWVRHVVVDGYTFNEKYLYDLGLFIGELKNVKALDVLPYHEMGEVKYKNLNIEYPLKNMPALKKEDAIKAREIILKGIKDKRRELKNA